MLACRSESRARHADSACVAGRGLHAESMHTTEELNLQRAAYLESTVIKGLRKLFLQHPQLRSATLLVSQYWNDEASDAVHAQAVVSVLDTPDLDAYFAGQGYDPDTDQERTDSINKPFDLNWWDIYRATSWGSNYEAIPLFAAFCAGGGSQEQSDEQNCRPYCVLRRNEAAPTGFDVEIVGQMLRPHLDGVSSEEEM